MAIKNTKVEIAGDQEFAFSNSEELYHRDPVAKHIRNLVRENTLARFAAGGDGQDDISDFCENTDLQILFATILRNGLWSEVMFMQWYQ